MAKGAKKTGAAKSTKDYVDACGGMKPIPPLKDTAEKKVSNSKKK